VRSKQTSFIVCLKDDMSIIKGAGDYFSGDQSINEQIFADCVACNPGHSLQEWLCTK